MTTILTSDWSGYVALDDFEFVHSSEDAEYCTTKPASATPSTESPATPTHPPVLPPQVGGGTSCNIYSRLYLNIYILQLPV